MPLPFKMKLKRTFLNHFFKPTAVMAFKLQLIVLTVQLLTDNSTMEVFVPFFFYHPK